MLKNHQNIALPCSQQELEACLHILPFHAYARDASGRLCFLNARLRHLLKLDQKDIEDDIRTLFPGAEAHDHDLALDQIVLHTGAPQEYETILTTPDGQSRCWVIHKFPLTDAAGNLRVGTILWDISRRKQRQFVDAEHMQFIQNVLRASPDVLYVYDLAEQRNVYVNHEIGTVLGYTPEAIHAMGSSLLPQLMHPDDLARLSAYQQRYDHLAEGETQEWEYRMRHANGEWRWLYSREMVFQRDAQGRVRQIVGSAQDVTVRKSMEEQMEAYMLQAHEANVRLQIQRAELEAANERLQELATIDGLTGLKNHRSFQEMLQKEFERALRYQRPLSLILLDVDHFKKFNDTFGHPAGDEALRQVARILLEQTRTADFVARYGGEEFVVLLSDTDQEGALLTAERLRARLEAAAWSRAPLTASLGVATLQERTPRGSELTEQADQALYASKQQGRNRVTHYRWLENPVLHQASEESGIRAR